ncbi:SDR family NAD(P)-dependent oxidoreductase [Nostocoides sp. F2B08]|uniref:SDR family NAD(P)-dependent oxidoreductase n=1 Tax=Nostocoides sp. F2B08 TaxID=2653936 RepID=UPI001262D947|nr:SDR family oxidoreductase [Tetrasphaera sp. F2B08]KAB7745176.1 SDR family NAD(P)-dependent oxidoreductase [Tetrasphaera sp. F2B08]
MPTVLVTGATAGIGREFVRQYAEQGYAVVAVARTASRLEKLADETRRTYGVRVEVVAADLVDRAALEGVAQRLRSADDPVDVLVNNAGLGLKSSFTDNDLATEEAAFDLMCRAVLVLSHAAATTMRARGRGEIINVSSVASFISAGSYSAAKAYVTVLTEALSTELAGSGVSATALCPGFTHTEFHERGGMDVSYLPEAAWLDVRDVVAAAIADSRAGRAISVPSAKYKALVGLLQVTPRRLLRARLATPRHRR